MIKVNFVCMGNICRSPTAEGVFRHLVEQEGLSDQIRTDSSGTHAYHVGNAPDSRSQTAAQNRGIDISDLRARQVRPIDFEQFDYILAMDYDNHAILERVCPHGLEDRLHMFLSFAPNNATEEVPDPYYGGGKGFEVVLDLIEEASQGLLAHIKANHLT